MLLKTMMMFKKFITTWQISNYEKKSVIKAGFFIYKFDIIKACLAQKLIIKKVIKTIIDQKEFL